jgi:hypothetical protein
LNAGDPVSDDLAFSPEWLALREPADLAARSTALVEELACTLRKADPPSLWILDLAAGTGANLRALAPHLPAAFWTLVDLDPVLLEQAPTRMSVWAAALGCETTVHPDRMFVRGSGFMLAMNTAVMDLRALSVSNADEPSSPDVLRQFEGRTLVTASALLDLLSERQVLTLARMCSRARQIVYFALTYDGRISFSPSEPEDEAVRTLVNRHQRTDKGFGAALGPDATDRTAGILTEAGYRVRTEPSGWVLGPEFAELQRQLLAGWARAAGEIAPGRSATIADWLARRLAHVDRGPSRLEVGHTDLLASLNNIE